MFAVDDGYGHSRADIGRRVKAARLDKGYSLTELGDLIGHPATSAKQCIFCWEQGKAIPDTYIRALSVVLGIPCSLLLP